jgi:uncharacterized YccA/Bax inhibitor family protein
VPLAQREHASLEGLGAAGPGLVLAQIEEGVRAGLPRKYGWLGAFGILVELIWLYLEFLRLISYFQDE